MNKTRKGILYAASIVTIVSCVFAIIGSIILLVIAPIIDEQTVLDLYKSDPTTEIVEDVDGGYTIYVKDDYGEVLTIDDETLVVIVKVIKVGCIAICLFSFALALAKFILAIQILRANGKDEYKTGRVIALLVLSILSTSIIETILIVISMCVKQKPELKDESNQNKIEDIVLKDIN